MLEGQNVVNSLPQKTAVSPAVEVIDYLGNPVEGADVTFEAPASGPGGVFGNQTPVFKTRTDARGQAGSLFTPNTLPGSFVIRVTASFSGLTATAAIRQTNDARALIAGPPPPKRAWYKDWKWWTVIGAGAGAGAYFGLRGSSSDPTITLTPGAIVIGGPR